MTNNQTQNQESNIRKVALTALAGTSIEWYDFFLYGAAAALIFPKAFFPAINSIKKHWHGHEYACDTKITKVVKKDKDFRPWDK